MTTKAFHVPADLADSDLTLSQVQAIIEMRRRRQVLQNRLDGLPAKATQLKADIKKSQESESLALSGSGADD